MNRIDRLTGTLLMLQSRHHVTVSAIASHWEISERTVYRDIAALCEAGIPIVWEPDVGYRLMGGYEIPPVMFSEQEALALFLGGEIAEQFADESLRQSLRSALVKIRMVLPGDRRKLLEGFKQSLGIWMSGQAPKISTRCLIPLHNAVLRRRCVRLQYDTAGLGVVTERIVEPLGILYYASHWHLVAWCRLREDYRDFRLDRVKACEATGETFEGHSSFSVDGFVAERASTEELLTVIVSVKNEVAERFRRSIHFDRCEETPVPNGGTRFRFQCPWWEGLSSWMLAFGPDLRVESPPSLVDTIRLAAADMARQYVQADVHFSEISKDS
jgi:predicted DNA-binding transcriptional regulator YafY